MGAQTQLTAGRSSHDGVAAARVRLCGCGVIVFESLE